MNETEESLTCQLDYKKLSTIGQKQLPVVPVVVQDRDSKEVLILAYANKLALEESLKRNIAVFWSTSRDELWVKGETSGDYLKLHEVRVNCEQNSLLFIVSPQNSGACHTKDRAGKSRKTCYYRRLNQKALEFVKGLE